MEEVVAPAKGAEAPKPIVLTVRGYWVELNEMATKGLLPVKLTNVLASLVNVHLLGYSHNPPQVDGYVIGLAIEHLKGGIDLVDPEGNTKPFEVVLFGPPHDYKYNEGEVKRTTTLRMVDRCEPCRIRYLDKYYPTQG